jgi:hypothetical protein
MREEILEEVRWSAPELIDILKGNQEMDTLFFLNALQVVGLAQKTDEPELDKSLSEINALAHGQGSEIVSNAFEQLSFEGLFVSTLEDEAFNLVKFQELVEFTGLYQFMNDDLRLKLRFILTGNLALIRSYADKFECLHVPATYLADHIMVSKDHVVRKFLRDVIRATRNAWLGIV